MKKIIQVILIEDKDDKSWTIKVGGDEAYTPFDDETKAKAAAFDEVCKAQITGATVIATYLSH